jgi:DME family drug/metabolite transporter
MSIFRGTNTMSLSTAVTGRLCILFAALLWSLGGAFTKVFTENTFAGVHEPPVETWAFAGTDLPIQLACYRALFAGLVLAPTLRRGDIQFRPLMFAMVLCFAVMNATFISAQALGTAANAILLQNSAPLWLYLVSIFWLGETPDRRGSLSLFLGLFGIAIIIAGGWQEGKLPLIGIGLLSGFTYAGVILCLRVLRDMSTSWLTVWNHLIGGLALVPFVLMLRPPSWQQYIVLFLFGAIQLGLPYWLMARGLRSVSAPEAGAITLLEPVLNPVWTYLVCGEQPHPLTYAGGAVILVALAYRYWPRHTGPESVRRQQAPG